MRLIDADKVVENIDEWLDSVGYATVGKGLSYYGELIGCVDEAPTITPSGWASVKDRLPDVGDLVVYADRIAWGYQYGIRRISRDDRIFREERSLDFWMPLPEPPKED